MRLELSRFLESDLDAIAAFIAEDNPHRAVSFIQEIRHKLYFIAQNPLAYRLRPEIGERYASPFTAGTSFSSGSSVKLYESNASSTEVETSRNWSHKRVAQVSFTS